MNKFFFVPFFVFFLFTKTVKAANPTPSIIEDGSASTCNFGIRGPNQSQHGFSYASGFVANISTGVGYQETLQVQNNQQDQIFHSLGSPQNNISNLVFSLSSEFTGSSYFIDFCLKPSSIKFKPSLPGANSGNQSQGSGATRPVPISGYNFSFQLFGQSLGNKTYWTEVALSISGELYCQVQRQNPQNSGQHSLVTLQQAFGETPFSGQTSFDMALPNHHPNDRIKSCVFRVSLQEAQGRLRSHQHQVQFTSIVSLEPNF